MNPAPISRTEIYDWLRIQIVKNLEAAHPKLDFDDLNTLQSIYASEINSFRKGVGRLFEKDPNVHAVKLGEFIQGVSSDVRQKASSYTRYFSLIGNKLVIFVLDNLDKRLRDEQLLMFESAQWLLQEYRGLVVLPLREETYDNHRNEKPLDTALKDLVFRIEPPLFQKVLQSRVQLALRSIVKKGQKTLRYDLPNGMQVEYAASDQAYYLASIMRSVFEHDQQVRRLIIGLSGRNIRRALEIFLDFCTSGHIGEDEFLRIKQSQGQHVLPLSLVTKILLRVSKRYYSSSHAYLKNIFSVDERDERPNFFSRYLILRFLERKRGEHSGNRLRGYVQVQSLRSHMASHGVTADTFHRELEALARGYCVISEDFRVDGISDDTLVSIAPAGYVHLEMKNNVYYLAAIAEDTWFDKKPIAEAIANRIKEAGTQYAPSTTLYNAQDVLALLSRFGDREREISSFFTRPDEPASFVDLARLIHDGLCCLA